MPTAVVENEEQQEQQQNEEQSEYSPENQEQEGEADKSAEDSDEVVVTIGEQSEEEEQQETAPQWVKELRVKHREAQKELRELREKLQQQTQVEQSVRVGDKPTLESCGWDDSRYESELASWFDRKRQADEHQRKAEEEQVKQQQAWQAKLDGYAKAKAELKVKDFDEAEDVIKENFNQVQQGIIVQGAKNPALVVYALGKNPSKMKELSSITDPVQFAVAIGEIGKEIQMRPKQRPPAPERVPSGSGSLAGATDRTLDMLRTEAEKTGDYTKVMQYKNQLKQRR